MRSSRGPIVSGRVYCSVFDLNSAACKKLLIRVETYISFKSIIFTTKSPKWKAIKQVGRKLFANN